MKKYIVLTSDGHTTDEDNNEVENCQMLGLCEGENEKQALKNLKQVDSWMKDYKFENVVLYELSDKDPCYTLLY